MCRVVVILLVACLWDTGYTACPPNACVGVQCVSVQCGSAERYDAQGGVCGCCPACIPDIRIVLGESCARVPGQYSTPLCADGLRCHTVTSRCVVNEQQRMQNSVAGRGDYCGPSFFHQTITCAEDLQCVGARCVPQNLAYQFNNVPSCRQMAATNYQTWMTRARNNWYTLISWLQMANTETNVVPADLPPIPTCKDDGTYAPVQCLREGNSNRCYCASSSGTILRQYPANQQTSTCLCAQAQADYAATGMVGQTFSCENDGSYKAVQCIGSVCYCSDILGNKLTKYSAPISNIRALGCACARDEARSVFGFTGSCDELGNYPDTQL